MLERFFMQYKAIENAEDIPALAKTAIIGSNILIILLVGWIITKLVLRFTKKMLDKSNVDDVSHRLVIRVVRDFMWVMIGFSVLSYLKVDMTPFIAVFTAAGAAIALAIKDSLSNVAGGLIMIFTKPFVKGDQIRIGEYEGLVDYTDIMNTHLHTLDNQIIIIPNSKVVADVVTNYSARDRIRLVAPVSISYGTDIDKAKEVILSALGRNDIFLKEPEPFVGVAAHNDSSIGLDIKVWIKTEDRFSAGYVLYEEVKKEFDREGVEIPFPQMDVHFDSEQ